VNGAAAVVGLVALEWTAGWLAVASWTQSWSVVRRGHFRIVAWGALVFALPPPFLLDDQGSAGGLSIALLVGAGLYLLVQYSRTDVPGTVLGALSGAVGVAALICAAGAIDGWNDVLAAAVLISGALLLGAITNGLLLGHWYLNQPGLKPWALARLTALALVAVGASALAGAIATNELASASTEGSVLGLPGFGESFGPIFFGVWATLIVFTGGVVWAARRCIAIKSIQSATGLYYVAVLTAGVAEFVSRYLMVNAT
jgi:hypothetical protein